MMTAMARPAAISVKVLHELPESAKDIEVMSLSNTITLQPPVSICMTSDAPFNVYWEDPGNPIYFPISVDAEPPLISRITSDIQISIQPTAPLGAGFIRGWNKLPDELKVHVLCFSFKAGRPVGVNNNLDHPYKVKELQRSLHMAPEIATLSRDIWWSENECLLEPSC